MSDLPKPGTREWYIKYESAPAREQRLADEDRKWRHYVIGMRVIVGIGFALFTIGTVLRLLA